MNRIATNLIVCALFTVITGTIQAATFAEALKECRNKDTAYCQKVKKLYLKKRAENRMKGEGVLSQSKSSISEPALEAAVAAKLAEMPSKFGMGYFGEISGIGKKTDAGESKLGMYNFLEATYKMTSNWTAYMRVQMLFDLAINGDEEALTMLDPLMGIKGTLWSSGKWSLWGRLRAYLPLSEGSVDAGVTFGWRTEFKVKYAGDHISPYLLLVPRGQFFGFGSDDRSITSLSLEAGLGGIKLGGGIGLTLYYETGYNRESGNSSGIFIFDSATQNVAASLDYSFNKYLWVAPTVVHNLDASEASLIVWFGGSFF